MFKAKTSDNMTDVRMYRRAQYSCLVANSNVGSSEDKVSKTIKTRC